MAEPIIVATDGSEPAVRALEWAADEAARWELPLHVVHVVERWISTTPIMPPPDLADSFMENGRRILAEGEEIARSRRPGIEVTAELLSDPVVFALRQQSKRGFEMVLGHRGLGGFASMLLGSTGMRVAGHAAGPVVIVRGDDFAERGEVVVGIDLADVSEPAMEYAYRAAAVRGARLRVLHGWELPPALLQTGYGVDQADVEESMRSGLVHAQEHWRGAHPGVEVVESTVRAHPVTALVEASGEADLVVVGARGRTGLGAFRLGSVSHGVIHHSHVPVAVVRPRV
ncbi:universal stress protein [Actinomadura craniellae]|uniref:Universal stress protein n=1 Tax=Actinomadura craniellae TaxID=2231787 RepID=A0A365GX47_9ACTN|nr:universal stress protein [Actinomadura craniellae]RAY11405.1 universal stress protein [Actinomadura craniellae]